MRTVNGLYDNYADAQDAVGELEASGVPSADISIVANNSDDWYEGDERSEAAEEAGTGAGIGALVGGAGGLLTGRGIMAIPRNADARRAEDGRERSFTLLRRPVRGASGQNPYAIFPKNADPDNLAQRRESSDVGAGSQCRISNYAISAHHQAA